MPGQLSCVQSLSSYLAASSSCLRHLATRCMQCCVQASGLQAAAPPGPCSNSSASPCTSTGHIMCIKQQPDSAASQQATNLHDGVHYNSSDSCSSSSSSGWPWSLRCLLQQHTSAWGSAAEASTASGVRHFSSSRRDELRRALGCETTPATSSIDSSSDSSSSEQSSKDDWWVEDADVPTNWTSSSHPRGRRGGQRTAGSKAVSAPQLTAAIKACSTVQKLQELVQHYGPQMNFIHLSAAVTHLAQMQSTRAATTGQQKQQAPTLQLLEQCWQLLQPQLDQCGVWALSNILWAASKLQCQLPELYSACLQQYIQAWQDHTPRDLSNVVYGLCKAPAAIQQQHQAAVMQQLVPAFFQHLSSADPQSISNFIYALAAISQQLEADQVQQLVNRFCAVSATADAKAIANVIWSVATMGQQLQTQQLQQLMEALIGKLHHAIPQDVSNTLWAVATMGQQLQPQQLEQLVGALIGKLHHSIPQDVSNTLWACAKLNYLPMQLLSAPQLVSSLARDSPQGLANIAWACGQLGHRDGHLLGALLQELLHRVAAQGSKNSFTLQTVSNACWSVAVLDLQQHAHQLVLLAQAGSQQWGSMTLEHQFQLYQVHNWLLDCQLAGGQGLLGALTEQQLLQCKAAWDAGLTADAKSPAPALQRSVFAAVQKLPVKWQHSPKMEQLSVGRDGAVDGVCLIDIAGRTAAGVLLAIEADGPSHFRQPDRGLTGSTQYRNRALAARGYTVVSVPCYDWDQLKGSKQQQQYLVQRLQAAGVKA